MRVLHIITDTNIGGAGRYLLNLLSQPAFDELEVVVACPDGLLAERMDAAGMNRIPVSGRDISYSTALTRELIGLMREVRPDIVHTHSSLSGRLAAKFLRIPVVYTKHNLVRIPNEAGIVPPRAGTFRRLINRSVASLLSERVIAVSAGVEKDLVESGLPASLITAIPNGIDLTPYKRRRPRHKDERGMVIGTVARLHRQKALDVMFEAAKLVLAAEPSVRFVVGGTGPLEDALKAKLRELRLEPYVKMAGFISDVPGFLAELDIYALSSDYEGLPLAVLEAMGAGLPVVSTAVGGVPEAIVDGENGLLVPPRQPKALAQAMVRLAVDPDLAFKMGQSARKRAEELFDAKIMAEKTVQVYREVLAGKKRRS
ncbi:MAG: glycosyltransferase family 4 protein [Bacillota bacterium]|jgi:glycosyltransferase involved in cell wall biosynthesis